jgi:hypothetical protein
VDPSEHGPEIYRYFAEGKSISIRSDGTICERDLRGDWKLLQYKPIDAELQDWIARHQKDYEEWENQPALEYRLFRFLGLKCFFGGSSNRISLPVGVFIWCVLSKP